MCNGSINGLAFFARGHPVIAQHALLRSAHASDNGFVPRNGFRPFDPPEAESTLGERFREVALRRGTATAVVDGNTRVSYTDLLRRAEDAAADLRSRCGVRHGIVAVRLPSGLSTVETIFGALLADLGYFCVPPSLPPLEVDALLRAVGPTAFAGDWTGISDLRRGSALVETRGPAGVAALYATSGSTGEPKMVALSHRAILFDIGRQTNDLYLGPDDRMDSLFSSGFSASLATMFGALLNGAELHCYDPRENLAGLPGWLIERRITVSTMTVSMLRHICMLGRHSGDFSLRLISVGGEPLRSADVDAFRSVFPPECVLQNAMASTEVRTFAQYFVPRDKPVENPVPIGWPVAGKELSLVDENGVSAGVEGEIVVKSLYLADGYSNDPRSTARMFKRYPDGSTAYHTGDRALLRADGSLVHLGRTDSQVKIRGHRVELDQIAHVIELHPRVRGSVVVACEDSQGNCRLAAYVVSGEGCTVGNDELSDFIRERLPQYAVPSAFVFLPALPLNANFKVDRRRLPDPFPQARYDSGRASRATIEVLRGIWKNVLQRSEIADDTSFADAGGDSLAAVRVLVAIHENFHCEVSPDALYRFPTLHSLAEYVETAVRGNATGSSVIVFNAGESGCPFFFVAGLGGSAAGYEHLAKRLASVCPSHASYGLNTCTELHPAPGLSVESMAAKQVAEIESIVPRGGKAVLAGYSFGGTIAFEIARQLRERGSVDPLPIVIDMPAVNAPGLASRSFGRKVLDVVQNLPAWGAHELANFQLRPFFWRACGNFSRMVRVFFGRTAPEELDPRIYFGKSSLPGHYQALLTAMYAAMRSYVPKKSGGRMIILRTEVPTLFRSRDRSMGWQLVAPDGLEVHMVPGRHDDCLSESYGLELASVLVRCSADFQSGEDDPAPAAESASLDYRRPINSHSLDRKKLVKRRKLDAR